MKNNDTKRKFFSLINIVLMVFLAIYFFRLFNIYHMLPDTIPTHWNVYGEIDGYGHKSIIYIIYGVCWFMLFSFEVFSKIDPNKNNYEKFSRVYEIFKVLIIALFIFLLEYMLLTINGSPVPPIEKLMPVSMGVMFIILGNYTPKIKQNYYFGIKCPWTLDNEVVWNKTHRFGGIVFVIMGLVWIVSAFLPSGSIIFAVDMIVTFASILSTFVYAYFAHKKEMQKKNDK